jgi:nicotinamidase/pyrazinamidase
MKTRSGDEDQNLDLYRWCIYYTEKLEEEEEINLTIWPEHCLIGTEGWCMVKEVRDAVREWEITTGRTAEFICKGHCNLTEMYSAMMAAVPVCQYTSFNQHIVGIASRSKQVLMCGQASSHCVNFTTRYEAAVFSLL